MNQAEQYQDVTTCRWNSHPVLYHCPSEVVEAGFAHALNPGPLLEGSICSASWWQNALQQHCTDLALTQVYRIADALSSVHLVLSVDCHTRYPLTSQSQCSMPDYSSQDSSTRHTQRQCLPLANMPLSVVQRSRLMLVYRPLVEICRKLDGGRRWWWWMLNGLL